MPVLVNYNRCSCMPTCFAANVCPKDTLRVDKTLMKVVVDATVCGDCHAPCLNFCDAVALKYAPNLLELDIMQRELDGLLSKEAAVEERRNLVETLSAAEAALAAPPEEAQVVISAPIILTTENFIQEVAESELPVLVDFWAEWCGPCKQIAPIVEDLATEFAGIIKFGKLNTDDEPQIAGQLGIQSIPTLMIFYGGQVADMIVGVVPKEQLRARLQRVADAVAQLQAQAGAQVNAPAPTVPAPRPTAPPPRPNIARPGVGGPPPRRPRR